MPRATSPAPWNEHPGQYSLTAKERAICDALWEAHGRLVSWDTILRRTYGDIEADWPETCEKCVMVFISKARKKIKDCATIRAARGSGYFMEAA